MKRVFVYKTKNVYGNELNYPMTDVEAIQKLTGTKTLSESHLKALKEMGFDVYEESVYWKVCQKALEVR